MKPGIGIRAVATAFPPTIRTNDHWEQHAPELIRDAEAKSLSRVFNNDRPPQTHFDRAMQPYLRDPFRGAQRRRVLTPPENGIAMEVAAGRRALQAADRAPADVDTIISVGFLPEHIGPGNAVFVADALGHGGNAWNLESACAGPLQAVLVAHALVSSGQARRVLVTVSCTYTTHVPPSDTLGWFMGDGGGALLIEPLGEHEGVLGAFAMNTADTCGSWYYGLELDADGAPRTTMRASPQTGRLMRSSAEPHLVTCAHGALAQAGLRLADIDCLVPHTPTAWFADFAASTLGFDPERTVDTYPDYANMGPALTPGNLHRAVTSGLLKPGGTALVFGPGSVSSAAAVVLRWGQTSIAPLADGLE